DGDDTAVDAIACGQNPAGQAGQFHVLPTGIVRSARYAAPLELKEIDPIDGVCLLNQRIQVLFVVLAVELGQIVARVAIGGAAVRGGQAQQQEAIGLDKA